MLWGEEATVQSQSHVVGRWSVGLLVLAARRYHDPSPSLRACSRGKCVNDANSDKDAV